jgi:hypothetical protein
VVYLPASVREQLRAAADRDGSTYTAHVLDALEATHHQLSFADAARPAGELFRARPRRQRLRHDEPQVQVSLRPLQDELDVIDRLVGELGAPSRSALVASALRTHLAQGQSPTR